MDYLGADGYSNSELLPAKVKVRRSWYDNIGTKIYYFLLITISNSNIFICQNTVTKLLYSIYKSVIFCRFQRKNISRNITEFSTLK